MRDYKTKTKKVWLAWMVGIFLCGFGAVGATAGESVCINGHNSENAYDVNEDGEVNVLDILSLIRQIRGINPDTCGDINGGGTNVLDLLDLLHYIKDPSSPGLPPVRMLTGPVIASDNSEASRFKRLRTVLGNSVYFQMKLNNTENFGTNFRFKSGANSVFENPVGYGSENDRNGDRYTDSRLSLQSTSPGIYTVTYLLMVDGQELSRTMQVQVEATMEDRLLMTYDLNEDGFVSWEEATSGFETFYNSYGSRGPGRGALGEYNIDHDHTFDNAIGITDERVLTESLMLGPIARFITKERAEVIPDIVIKRARLDMIKKVGRGFGDTSRYIDGRGRIILARGSREGQALFDASFDFAEDGVIDEKDLEAFDTLRPFLAADMCQIDSEKIIPGICGCEVADTDSDGDGVMDCNDQCPDNRASSVDNFGCGTEETVAFNRDASGRILDQRGSPYFELQQRFGPIIYTSGKIINTTDPTNVVYKEGLDFTYIMLEGDRLYTIESISNRGLTAKLSIYDNQDPLNPQLLGSMSLVGPNLRNVHNNDGGPFIPRGVFDSGSFLIKDGRFYIIHNYDYYEIIQYRQYGSKKGLFIYDLADPTDIKELGHVELASEDDGKDSYGDLVLEGARLYLTRVYSASGVFRRYGPYEHLLNIDLQVIDVSDVRAPQRIETQAIQRFPRTTNAYRIWPGRSLWKVNNGRLFYRRLWDQLEVLNPGRYELFFDIRNPRSTGISVLPTPTNPCGVVFEGPPPNTRSTGSRYLLGWDHLESGGAICFRGTTVKKDDDSTEIKNMELLMHANLASGYTVEHRFPIEVTQPFLSWRLVRLIGIDEARKLFFVRENRDVRVLKYDLSTDTVREISRSTVFSPTYGRY